MARGRFVSRSISTSDQLAKVSLAADFLFGRLIPHLDVEGRMRASPWDIKSQVVPKRPEITEETIPALIGELANALDHEGQPLVISYTVAGEQFLWCPGFTHHNKVRRNREGESRLPPPPTGDRVDAAGTGSLLASSHNSGSQLREFTPGVNSREHGAEGSSVAFAFTNNEKSESEANALAARPVVARFLETFYGRAGPGRRRQVLEQLERALTTGGCRVDRRSIAYASVATLERALEATLATTVRKPDAAILIVLRKLVSGPCNVIDPPGLARPDPESGTTEALIPSAYAVAQRSASSPWTRDRDARRTAPSAAPTPIAVVLGLPPSRGITDEDRSAAAQWVASRPEVLVAIEAAADRHMANVHPRWTQLSWCAAVRARVVEDKIVEAYRAADRLVRVPHSSPLAQGVG